MVISTDQIASIAKDNLFLIFGGKTKEARLEHFKRLWHPDGQFVFLEPGARCTTFEEADAIIVGLQKSTPGFVFTVVGDVQVLAPNGDETVARLKWGYGPTKDDFKVTGEDVFTIVDNKIKTLFTFID